MQNMKLRKIEEEYLQQLRAAGLFVSAPYPEGHSWEFGVRVAKPVDTAGNSVAGFNSFCNEVKIDAPPVVLYSTPEGCFVHSQEHIPKAGPGDFTNVWPTAQEAVNDILDFYLGNPERMAKKAEVIEEGRKRLKAAQAEAE